MCARSMPRWRNKASKQFSMGWAAVVLMFVFSVLRSLQRIRALRKSWRHRLVLVRGSLSFGLHGQSVGLASLLEAIRPLIAHRRNRQPERQGAPPALHHGLHLPRAPRRGDLPVQGPALAKAWDGMLPSDFF